jgi:outer membrane protein TolC
MRRWSLSILMTLLVSAAATEAEIGTEEQQLSPLPEEEFLAAVDPVHPASRALAGDLRAAEAERLQAGLLEEPRIEVERQDPHEEARETTLGVVWRPPIDGRRRWAVRAAEAGVETERHLFDSRLSLQRLELRASYSAWLAEQARVELLADHSERFESLAERVRRRADSGEASDLEARRLEIALGTSKAALSRARAAAAASRARAAAWISGGALDLTGMRPTLPELPEAPPELSSDAGWAERPDLLAASSRVEEAQHRERLSRRVVEAPELLLGWKQIEVAGSDSDGPVFGIDWRIPLFDRRRAERLAAESALAAAMAGEEWTRQRAQGELGASLAAYVELRQAALSAREQFDYMEGVGRAATAAFEQGETGVTDLLGSLQSLLDARLSALDLYLAALEAHRQLEFAAGRPLTPGDRS